MHSISETLLSRIPANVRAGRRVVIRNTLAAAGELTDAVRRVASRDELSPKGRAAALVDHVKEAGRSLRRSRRQLDYLKGELAKQDAAIRAKAIGEPQPTDAEYRTYLRSLNPGERHRLVLENKDVRGPALREPALSGLDQDMIEKATAAALREADPQGLADMESEREAITVHDAAARVLSMELQKVPFIVEASGGVRPFASDQERETYLDKNLPTPFPKDIALEEVQADLAEDPAEAA
jgi:hypothetical protein